MRRPNDRASQDAETLRPGRLWSLLEIMRTFDADRFMALANVLGTYGTVESATDTVIPDDYRTANIEALGAYFDTLTDLSMGASWASLRKLVAMHQQKGSRFGDLTSISNELYGRLFDEASLRTFFSLSLKESEFYVVPRRGWEAVIQRFPETVDDIEEACRCFALSRYPAAVYHSVQVVEVGLIELGRFLKVSDPHSGWTSVTNALEAVIKKKHADRTPYERKHFPFLEQVHGTVQALKNAWRNKISHAHGRAVLMGAEFSPDTAEEILMASRSFSRRLAEGLPPPKRRRTKFSRSEDVEFLENMGKEIADGVSGGTNGPV